MPHLPPEWLSLVRTSDGVNRMALHRAPSVELARDLILYDMPRSDIDRIVEMRIMPVADMPKVPVAARDNENNNLA